MRFGFAVHWRADGAVELALAPAARDGRPPLTTWAADPASGTAAVLLGRLFYRDAAAARLPELLRPGLGSDAALALAVYRHAGREGLERLEGEYALAVWDGPRGCLWAARDPLASWPLFWRAADGGLSVATGLGPLVADGRTQPSMEFLADFLMRPAMFPEPAGEATPLEAARRVPAGAVLEFGPGGAVRSRSRWDWASRAEASTEPTLEVAGERFGQLFGEAVRLRLGPGPVAAHLSGGMDSSAVACTAREWIAAGAGPAPLHTLSMVYTRPALAGERAYIDAVVRQGGPVVAHYLESDEILGYDWFPDKVPAHDEPYTGLPGLGVERVLIEAADRLGAAVTLTGEGSDQILYGDASHIADLLRRGRWVAAAREAAVWSRAGNQGLWTTLCQSGLQPIWPVGMRDGLRAVLRRGTGAWPRLGYFSVPPWVPADFARRHELRLRGRDYARWVYGRPAERSVHLAAVAACVGGDWGKWALAAPRGLQISHPFADPRLVGFCLGLPRALRAVPGRRKPVLQAALAGLLPEAVRTRGDKRGFSDVYRRGLAVHLPELERLVQVSRLADWGVLDRARLLDVLRQAAAGVGDATACNRLNKTLALAAWAEQPSSAEGATAAAVHCWAEPRMPARFEVNGRRATPAAH